MSMTADWESHSYKDWKQKVIQELKGASFEESLQSKLSGITIEPLYTDRPEIPAIQEEEDEMLWESDQAGMRWQISESVHYQEGPVSKPLQEAFKEQVTWLRLTGNTGAFLDQLAEEVPLPVTLCVEAGKIPADEEAVRVWRERIRKAKAHHPFIWSLEFDPVGSWAKSGEIETASESFDHLYDLIHRLSGDMTDTKFIRVDAALAGGSGAGPLTEIAWALSAGACYLQELQQRGMELFEAAQLLVFRFGAGTDLFAEIAKIRAFRTCWRNLLETLDPDFAYMEHPPIHIRISDVFYTRADKHNNLLRGTTGAISAILGGADVIEIPPIDNSEQAARMARNIQRLLRFESHMDSYAQAASGSYYLEHLERELTERAWQLFCQWEDNGGCLEQLKKGVIQEMISLDRKTLLEAHLSGERIQIGVNKFVQENPDLPGSAQTGETTFPAILPWNLEQAIRDEQVAE